MQRASMNDAERSRTYPTRPYLAVSAAIFRDGKVLIVRRARPPAQGVYTLPGGGVELGETLEEAVIREVREETGITAEVVTKLADNKYVYVRKWSDGARVFKIVSFYLMRYVRGEIDELTSDMRIEVKQALWVPLDEATTRLEHSSERKVLKLAQEMAKSSAVSSQRK